MFHLIILYIIILVLSIRSIIAYFKNKKESQELTVDFRRSLLKRTVPPLVDFLDKEIIRKFYKEEKEITNSAIRKETISLNEENPLLKTKYNTIPMNLREFSLLILVNSSLGMKPGKIISQISHGLFNLFLKHKENKILYKWYKNGQAKIICKADELQIMEKVGEAKFHNVPFELIRDAGRTQVKAGSLTVVVIGPYFSFVNKEISKKLKLM